MSASRKIQNSNLNIRVSKQLLEDFEKACDGVPKSIVLRMLMQNYVNENTIDENTKVNNV